MSYSQLDARSLSILRKLVYAKGYHSIKGLAEEFKINERSIYYDLNRINEWLSCFNIAEIESNNGVIHVTSQQMNSIKVFFSQQNAEELFRNYILSNKEREHIILCSLILKYERMTIDEFMSICDVSRNTIIRDLNNVKILLEEYKLELKFSSKKGYYLIGNELNQRSLFLLTSKKVITLYRNQMIKFNRYNEVEAIYRCLKEIEKELRVEYVPDTVYSIAMLLDSVLQSPGACNLSYEVNDDPRIIDSLEYGLIDNRFPDLCEMEKFYFTLHLLGSRTQSLPVDFNSNISAQSYIMARRLIEEFSKVSFIIIKDKNLLTSALAFHLQSSLYRYKYGVQVENLLFDSIRSEYSELFEITKVAVKKIEKRYNLVINDNEIAYITLHFGAYTSQITETKASKRILIICPNGVAASNLIKAEVIKLVPRDTKIEVASLGNYEHNGQYDLVISTLELNHISEDKFLLVNAILNNQDKLAIANYFNQNILYDRFDFDDIMKIAKKYISTKDLENFKDEIITKISSQRLTQFNRNEFGDRLLYYISASYDYLRIIRDKVDWKSAIYLVADPLIRSGSIETVYVARNIEQIILMKNYMFIDEHVLLAHSKADESVKRTDISFYVFKEPVQFPEGRTAQIIMGLSAASSTSHISILNDLLMLFTNSKYTDLLINTHDEEELLLNINLALKNESE